METELNGFRCLLDRVALILLNRIGCHANKRPFLTLLGINRFIDWIVAFRRQINIAVFFVQAFNGKFVINSHNDDIGVVRLHRTVND